MQTESDAYLTGRLIQWALRPRAIPFNEPEYHRLVERYHERSEFRQMVREVAEGLGLRILHAGEHGLFLGTRDESPFALKPSSFRPGQTSAEDRLLDGLVQVAIAAAVFPRQRDLEQDVTEARPPLTAIEVDESLRRVVEACKRAAPEADPETAEVDRGLHEAWRVYDSRPAVHQTTDGRRSSRSTQGLIERHLEHLVEHGCFTPVPRSEPKAYRPTMRYQVLVKELAAQKLHRRVRELLQKHADAHGSGETADA